MWVKHENNYMKLPFYCSLWFLIVSIGCSSSLYHFSYKRLTPLPDRLSEVSGISITHPDTLWLHNDSGDRPVLFKVSPEGEILDSVYIEGAQNVDWESLAADDRGNLYICDVGNNGNRRKDLRIYQWHPQEGLKGSIRFAYPEQTAYPPPATELHYDLEGVFWFQDSLYLFTKNRVPGPNDYTRLYALPAQLGEQVPILRDSLNLKRRSVTAAAIHPAGHTVALMTYGYRPIWFIPRLPASVVILSDFKGSDFLKGKMTRRRLPKIGMSKQYEAIDFWDGETLVVGAEKSPVNKPLLGEITLKRKRKRATP